MDTLDRLIVALCLDFERRCEAIKEKSFARRTLMEYRYLNARIYDAAVEIAGIRDGPIFIKDIGERIGYVNSELVYMSEVSYKRKKCEIKRAIAKKLYLTD